LSAAARHLSEAEYDNALLDRVAQQTDCRPESISRYFQTSNDVVIGLYSRFASDLESRVVELPESTLAERFRALINIKFEIMEPYRRTLSGLTPALSDPNSDLGVRSKETEMIRARVRGIIAQTIEGATDKSDLPVDLLIQNLYSLYLALMWVWFNDPHASNKRPEAMLNAACRAISVSTPFLGSALKLPLKVATSIQRTLLWKTDVVSDQKAREALRVLFTYRRLFPGYDDCASRPCNSCLALHLPKAAFYISSGRPIHLILPAFPAKSPNRRKTLGPLPDMAEEQALFFIADICSQIQKIHEPGVRFTICSDGHVFGDLVGVTDDEITAYGAELSRMIARLGLENVIDTFSLTDLYEDLDYEVMRQNLNRDYEQTVDSIKQRATRIPQSRKLVDGIHRFLFEDKVVLEEGRSRTQIRNECRELAYQVVQRSDGWGRLLSDCFPAALRLSIHPQEPHSDKIGILLGKSDDVWLTPWHSAAVKTNEGFKLMKSSDAKEMGATMSADRRYYELRG